MPLLMTHPKIYHIMHIDKLSSVICKEGLLSDANATFSNVVGTVIGMKRIKERRLKKSLEIYPDLCVGECVPFYFCPRSIMLYLIYKKNNNDLDYSGGQDNVIHFEADLRKAVDWANKNKKRWLFTLSNAGSEYFEERNNLARLSELDWKAINARDWSNCKEGKQAEFLIEDFFPFHLIERIGVSTREMYYRVHTELKKCNHKPSIEVLGEWYY